MSSLFLVDTKYIALDIYNAFRDDYTAKRSLSLVEHGHGHAHINCIEGCCCVLIVKGILSAYTNS